MHTPICDRLGIEFPIFAFSHCRDVVSAVTRAGGFGVLGALAFDPDELEIELKWIDEHCDGKPYGVDLVMPAKYLGQGGGEEASTERLLAMIPQRHLDFVEALLAEHGVPPLPEDLAQGHLVAPGLGVDTDGPAHVEIALNHPTSLLVNALGSPPKYVIDLAHQHDVLVGALAGTKQHAQRHVANGVDIVIAAGTEAGGHTGEISTMVLVPEVVQAVGPDVPVLAAGGIGTGRQITACLVMGAQGVWMGSYWLTVAEAGTTPGALQNLLEATSSDTVRTRIISGKPARILSNNAWAQAWERPDAPEPLPMPLQGMLWNIAHRRIYKADNKALSAYPVGQIVGQMNSVRPVRDVMFDLVEDAIASSERVASLFSAD
jgi:NAD(P)H-dependent flavin oxidoreductase YrpB (nitropropane dioxygenase family)